MAILRTFKNLLSMLWTGVDTFRKVLHLVLMLLVFGVFLGLMSATAPVMPSKAALLIQPIGNLVEQLEGDPYERALADLLGEAKPETLVADVVDGLAYAKDDDRIEAVVVDLGGLGGAGLSKLQQIAMAIDDFRDSGKLVIATADYYSQGAYYVAAHADEVYMHPHGILLFQGFGAYRNYYRTAIDKLKIDWNVFRVGTHKSFVEPYIRDDMSPEDRESLTRLLSQLWDLYQRDVVAARGLENGAIDALLENLVAHANAEAGDLALMALNAGLVDGLLTREALNEKIKSYVGEDSDNNGRFASAALDDFLADRRLMDGVRSKDENVAIIVAAGEIRNGDQPPGVIGGDSTADLLRRARHDESVKAVVLRVDSPGGSTFASEVIRNEVEELRNAGKPVVASMSSTAASGGYWISMAADRILANPATITGSIGVVGMFPTFQRTLSTLGVSTDGVGSSNWSGEFRPDREMSADARTLFQLVINKSYDEFITRVSEYRDMDKIAVDKVAQGQVWTSKDALDHGLIDGIGNQSDAIQVAAELAELVDGEYGEKHIKKEMSPAEQLAITFFGGVRSLGLSIPTQSNRAAAVDRLASLVEGTLAPLIDFDDPKGVYSHCFCVFD